MSVCDTNSTMLVQPANTGCNSGMGWGGDWSAWIIIFVLFFAFGGWGNGFGGNGATQGAMTRNDLCSEFSFQDVKNGIRANGDNAEANFRSLDNAICTLGYQAAQLSNGVQMQMANGFGTLDTSLCQLGNNISNQFHAGQITQLQGQNAIQAQLSDCCCTTQRAIDGINYNLATQACQTRQTINDAVRSLHDEIVANRLEDKNAIIAAQNQQLFAAQLAASQADQTAAIIARLSPAPVPAYPACPGQYQWQNVNNGCGCCA